MLTAEYLEPSPHTRSPRGFISSAAHDFRPVVELVQQSIQDGATPGLVLLVVQNGEVLFQQAFGTRTFKAAKTPEPSEIKLDTVFDVASVTSSLITATLAMKLVDAGVFSLDERVCRYEQSFGVLGKSAISLSHLLSHSAGLPAWLPFFEELLRENAGARRGIITSRGAREYIYHAINRLQVKAGLPGLRQVYSDVGMILLGRLVEQLTGVGLDKAAFRLIFQPLGMKSTSFVDLSMIKRRGIHPVTDLIAPTEECSWRDRLLCGEVHDDNAWVMGGIAGHSGLFTTAHDVQRLTHALLSSYQGRSDFISKEVVRHFWRGPGEFAEGWRYGWDSPSNENQLLSVGFGRETVGHNGFTGCSVWIDPSRSLEIVTMTNRVCPTRTNKRFLNVRPELHRRVLHAVDAVSKE